MKTNPRESFLSDPILITGILPLLPGVITLASGFYLSLMIILLSIALQLIASGLGPLLRPWSWKMCIIFASSIFVSIMFMAVRLADPQAALSLSGVVSLIVYSGVMRSQYSHWSADLEKGGRYDASHIVPALVSAAVIVLFSALREVLGAGTLSLPGFGTAAILLRIPPFSFQSSIVFAMPAGALLLSGYAAAALRLLDRGKAKGERIE